MGIKKLAVVLAAAIFGGSICYASFFWMNNHTSQMPDRKQLTVHLEKAIDWVEKNIDGVEAANNPPLWWMIKQSVELTGNIRLGFFYKRHEDLILSKASWYLWSNMFDSDASIKLPDFHLMQDLPNYNYLFLYGLTCDSSWANQLDVQKQLKPEFCSFHFFHPRCVTHQMMGVRFMQRRDCGDKEQVNKLIQDLQKIILTELTWDPRLVDAYIQRVLMLVDSGAMSSINPTWVNRILAAQNEDGGWGDFDPLMRLPGNMALGFSSTKLVFGELRSNFHATAQAIWLISLILSENKKGDGGVIF